MTGGRSTQLENVILHFSNGCNEQTEDPRGRGLEQHREAASPADTGPQFSTAERTCSPVHLELSRTDHALGHHRVLMRPEDNAYPVVFQLQWNGTGSHQQKENWNIYK
jgi:hypothetical protein